MYVGFLCGVLSSKLAQISINKVCRKYDVLVLGVLLSLEKSISASIREYVLGSNQLGREIQK